MRLAAVARQCQEIPFACAHDMNINEVLIAPSLDDIYLTPGEDYGK
ncbi:MAG: hypothetical protein ACHBNF_00790 [Chromatiales bacterium]